ncbi:DUF4352 domain-containing protein [Salinicoccus jeotgali]|uniref:DUF4352 domain-containing protein n=1 Tax=Salinicoccus jeotgali TaxID=381634 RepID=A0ABP7ESL3_9STAP
MPEQKTPIYKKSWFVIIMLIIFFPIGLYLMWAHTNWNKAAKWIVTAAIAVIGLSSLITGEDETDTAGTEVATGTEQSEEATSAPATVEEETEENTEEPTEEETVEKEEPTEEKTVEEEVDETASVGEALTVDEIDFVVNEWFQRDSVGTGLSSTANDTYLVLDVSVTNNKNEAVMLTSDFFKITDGEVVYEPDTTASTYMNQEVAADNLGLLAEEVNPGSSRNAYVVYDVAPGVIDSDTKQLQVQSGFWGTQTGIINLQ